MLEVALGLLAIKLLYDVQLLMDKVDRFLRMGPDKNKPSEFSNNA